MAIPRTHQLSLLWGPTLQRTSEISTWRPSLSSSRHCSDPELRNGMGRLEGWAEGVLGRKSGEGFQKLPGLARYTSRLAVLIAPDWVESFHPALTWSVFV